MDKHTATEQAFKNGYAKGYEAGKNGAMADLVRCKDCKHWTMGYCNIFAYYDYEPTTNEDDFCSYGERR